MKNYVTATKTFLGFCLLLFSCQSVKTSSIPYYKEASFSPHWLKKGSKEIKAFHKVAPFELTNQEGEKIDNSTFKGKIYVAAFFFTTCPGICPKMTDNMRLIQAAFLTDPNILLLSHSVTPSVDSVSVLKDYAKAKGVISSKWHLATGDKQLIYSLGRKSYFVEEDLGLQKKETDFIHTENFVLVDGDGHLRGIYNGLNKRSVNQLIEDIRTLKQGN